MAVNGTPGTGPVRLRNAARGYMTFAGAGALDGDTLTVLFEDGTDWEISSCVYASEQQTLQRTLKKSSTGALLPLTSNATASVIVDSEDLAGVLYSLNALSLAPLPPAEDDRLGGVQAGHDALFTVGQLATYVATLFDVLTFTAGGAVQAADRIFADQGAGKVAITPAQLRAFMSDFGGLPIGNYLGKSAIIDPLVTSLTPVATDTGTTKYVTTSSAFTLTLPNNLPADFHFTIIQWGTGVITPAVQPGGSGPFNSEGFTKSKQYGPLTFMVQSNVSGSNAVWGMYGVGST